MPQVVSVVLLASVLLSGATPALSGAERTSAEPAPAFTHRAEADWLNSPPLDWSGLRGRVVMIDVWAFDCWNCYRSIPWLQSLEGRFPAADFLIVGVHTPELPQERVLAKLRAKIADYGITYPVMVDNDYSYWRALGNRYWPAFYLVDREGRIRGRYVGETHVGDRRAERIEAQIAALIAEPAPSPP